MLKIAFFISLLSFIIGIESNTYAQNRIRSKDHVYLVNDAVLKGHVLVNRDSTEISLLKRNGILLKFPMTVVKKIYYYPESEKINLPANSDNFFRKKYIHSLDAFLITYSLSNNYTNFYNGGIGATYKYSFKPVEKISTGMEIGLQQAYTHFEDLLPSVFLGIGGTWYVTKNKITPILSVYSGYLKIWNKEDDLVNYGKATGGLYVRPLGGIAVLTKKENYLRFSFGVVLQNASYESNWYDQIYQKYLLKRYGFNFGIDF